jgi:enterochelin esterase-like enzyme
MVDRYVDDNGVRRLATADELAEINVRETAWNNDAPNRKLTEIKQIRLQKLKETDYYALQDVSMSNEMKTWRLNLRNIPQDYTTEAEYDLLLARDENGNLTHSVWSKP